MFVGISLLRCDEAADTVGRLYPQKLGADEILKQIQWQVRPGRVRMIYKICPASAWREAERNGVYQGSADDRRDGFIHFSTAAQVAETAQKHFIGQVGLFLIAVDADALGDALRWEVSRNDDLFPHLYGDLDLGAVTAVFDLPTRADGSHVIPELAP